MRSTPRPTAEAVTAAVAVVTARTEFEQFTETFPAGTMDEIQKYVAAARLLADAQTRVVLPEDLVTAIERLIEACDRAPTASTALHNAVTVARNYVRWYLDDHPDLILAVQSVRSIAHNDKRDDHRRLPWPTDVDEGTANVVTGALLAAAVPTFERHMHTLAQQMSWLNPRYPELVAELRTELEKRPACGEHLDTWAKNTHVAVQRLDLMLAALPTRDPA